eukprot:jgi/Mesvir1/21590/Mv04025-RA.1
MAWVSAVQHHTWLTSSLAYGYRRSCFSKPVFHAGRTSDGSGRRECHTVCLASSAKNAGPKFGEFSILEKLSSLGMGDLSRPPRETHFPGSTNEGYQFIGKERKFFVKINRSFRAADLFAGEFEGLSQMRRSGAIRVPEPYCYGDLDDGEGSYLIMEHLSFRPFAMIDPKAQRELGAALARMHLAPVDTSGGHGFGFPVTTCLGIKPLDNTWTATWEEFFVENRLLQRLQQVCRKLADASDMRSELLAAERDGLEQVARRVLRETGPVRPSLLHGDLWLGNSGLADGTVVIHDPACFVGHSEFDLAFRGWHAPSEGFPGLSGDFYEAYHEVIPRADGFEERHLLYQLMHLLNHMLIYGLEYFEPVMKVIAKVKSL